MFGQNRCRRRAKDSLDAVMRFLLRRIWRNILKPRQTPACRAYFSVENQYLLAYSLRMFSGMKFEDIGRLQLDIEVHSDEGFRKCFSPQR
ncbi:MAG: hypothetical protein ACLUKN_15840 [Bacilli bacterium]